MGDLFDFGGLEPIGLVGGSPVTQIFADNFHDEVFSAYDAGAIVATLAAPDAPVVAAPIFDVTFDAFEAPAPAVEAAPVVIAAAPLFTAFNWPEQKAFAFDGDDAFVAPKRFMGRVAYSWL